jgi:prevent-host-death family protein
MPTYTIHTAKTHLSKLVARAEAGEEIVLARGKEPVAKIVPVASKPQRKFGRWKGKIRIGPEFFEPLP